MMQLIRSNVGKVLVPVIMLFFLGWMVFQIGLDVMGGASGPGELGSVNGKPIGVQAYNDRYNALIQQVQAQGQEVTPELERRTREEAWEQLVNEALLRQELDRRGIGVSDGEILWAARNLPHPMLMQQEIFQTNGQFDLAKYRSFLASPRATPDMFAELEGYYRESLPREKLVRQLTAGRFLSDAELWRAFADRTETATVDYVALPVEKLAPTAPTVSDAEIRAYYEAHRDEYKRPEGARMKVAYVPLTVTEADRQATLQRLMELRSEIAGGADFAEVARRESEDKQSGAQGGDLGSFGHGQMVPAFDSAAFALPVNELSQPVITQFGAHLIQVTARTGEQVTARHILLSFRKSDAALDSIETVLDGVAARAQTEGLAKAAQGVPGVVVRDGVQVTGSAPFIPGVGPAADGLSWAAGAQEDKEAGEGTGISDVLGNDQALYVAQLEEYHTAGQMTLAQATPDIRALLTQRKRVAAAVAAAEKIRAEVAGGRTLEQVAQAHGYTVQRTGPFTRIDQNQVFGQANAAIGAAFGTPIGQVGPVAETPAGIFLIRPVSRTAADRAAFEGQKEIQRLQSQQSLQQDLFVQWLRDARESAKIKDNRATLTRRS